MVTTARQTLRGLLAGGALCLSMQGLSLGHAHAQPVGVEVHGPRELQLSRASDVTLDVKSADPAQAPLAWVTNVGRVDVQPDGRLLYTPASRHLPQVAIVAAYDAKTKQPVVHFIQLIGSPTVEVKSEPNVSVTVEVDKASFGPQRTNGAGIALVPIEVPPGVTTATTIATDSHGNVTRDALPLNPPSYPRLLTVCADEEAAVYVFEVNSDGTPATTPTFRVQSGWATSDAATSVEAGVFRVTLRSPEALTEPRRADIRVSTEDFSSACALELTPPPVALPYTLEGKVVPVDPPYPWFIGAHLGWLTNTSRISGPWLSVRGAYALSRSHTGLRIELEAGLSSSGTSVFTTDNQELDLSVRTFPLFASARYVVDWGLVHPMAALSAGVALSRAEASGANVLTDESFATPWLGPSAGALWSLGPHELTAELGYAWAKHSSGAVLGNVGGLKLTVGYQYAL